MKNEKIIKRKGLVRVSSAQACKSVFRLRLDRMNCVCVCAWMVFPSSQFAHITGAFLSKNAEKATEKLQQSWTRSHSSTSKTVRFRFVLFHNKQQSETSTIDYIHFIHTHILKYIPSCESHRHRICMNKSLSRSFISRLVECVCFDVVPFFLFSFSDGIIEYSEMSILYLCIISNGA